MVMQQKGGVGKTTTCHTLAVYLAVFEGLKVLLIDFDVQANATLYSLGEKAFRVFSEEDEAQPPKRKTRKPAPAVWTAMDIVERPNVTAGPFMTVKLTGRLKGGTGREGGRLDLIPASRRLYYTLDATSPSSDWLKTFLSNIQDRDYDVILVDCAPTWNLLARNAAHACKELIIPTTLNFLAVYGLPTMEYSLMKEQKQGNVAPLCGVLINMTVPDWKMTKNQRESYADLVRTCNEASWPIFKKGFPVSAGFPNGTRAGTSIFHTAGVRETTAAEIRESCYDMARAAGIPWKTVRE
jgi:cellulose biosynthesis protein BcsQ